MTAVTVSLPTHSQVGALVAAEHLTLAINCLPGIDLTVASRMSAFLVSHRFSSYAKETKKVGFRQVK